MLIDLTTAGTTAGPHASRTLRLLGDPYLTQAVRVAATLGIADHINGEPVGVAELAEATGCHADTLHRVLRYLTFAGVFADAGDRHYALTDMGRMLRSDAPGSLRAELSIGPDDRALWWSVGELMHSLRTGKPAYDRVYGRSFWDTLRASPEASARFQQGMAEDSEAIADSLSRHYDWSSVASVTDLGGGAGRVLARLLHQHPGLNGTVVDLPAVAAEATATLTAAGVAGRGRVVEGDLLRPLPAGADRYLLMRVLHDWPDDDATTILRNARNACGDAGRVLIVEMEVGGDDPTSAAFVGDMTMLVLLGGRERSSREFNALAGAAGLAIVRRTRLRGPYVVMEAVPIG
jgi:SAM-dependent methyltransferase